MHRNRQTVRGNLRVFRNNEYSSRSHKHKHSAKWRTPDRYLVTTPTRPARATKAALANCTSAVGEKWRSASCVQMSSKNTNINGTKFVIVIVRKTACLKKAEIDAYFYFQSSCHSPPQRKNEFHEFSSHFRFSWSRENFPQMRWHFEMSWVSWASGWRRHAGNFVDEEGDFSRRGGSRKSQSFFIFQSSWFASRRDDITFAISYSNY